MAGWLALFLAMTVLVSGRGGVIGIAVALLLFCLSGLLVVLLGAEVRELRIKTSRVAEPDTRPRRGWRSWARGMTAVFLAMFASVATGAAFTAIPMGAPAHRVAMGLLIVPFIWAALVIWALADQKLLRPVIGMAAALALSSAAVSVGLLA
jgi:Ca2+/Na+ antiporter